MEQPLHNPAALAHLSIMKRPETMAYRNVGNTIEDVAAEKADDLEFEDRDFVRDFENESDTPTAQQAEELARDEGMSDEELLRYFGG